MESAMCTPSSKIPSFDFRRFDPFRGTDWRWKIAARHYEAHTVPEAWEDPVIENVVRILQRDGIAPARTEDFTPLDLATAQSIYSALSPLRDEIEARLLAGQSPAAIAGKTKLNAGAIETFEAVFFNVADSLNAGGWINIIVIGLRPGVPPTEGQVWKCIAYACGSDILDLVIDDFHQRSATDTDNRDQIAARCRFMVRMETTDWSSPAAVQLMMAEARVLLPNLFDPNRPNKNPLDELHFKVLEWDAPAQPQAAPHAKIRKQKDYLTWPEWPKEGRRHGRLKDKAISNKPPTVSKSRRSPAPTIAPAG
jgi:hypothetical protein